MPPAYHTRIMCPQTAHATKAVWTQSEILATSALNQTYLTTKQLVPKI